MPLETLRIVFVFYYNSHTSSPVANLTPLELLKMRFKAISYIRRFKPLKYAQVYTNTLQRLKSLKSTLECFLKGVMLRLSLSKTLHPLLHQTLLTRHISTCHITIVKINSLSCIYEQK